MATGLTQIAGNFFGGQDEVDRILGLPITRLRLDLKHHYQDKKFTEDEFNAFIDRLGKADDLGNQAEIAKKAAVDRKVNDELDIELDTPAKQLLWAAVFTRMMHSGKEPVVRSPLWYQMQGTIGVNNEEIGTSYIINRSLQNKDVTFNWGQPGSWFYYNPRTNKINIDLYYTLLMGFEHTRAVTLHEIGHSELSNTYSKRMKELYEKVKILIDPSTIVREDKDGNKKKPRIKMKKAEYRQLMIDVAEWQLRFKLWHMTEDTVVNQFSSNMSDVSYKNQLFGKSLNHVSAVLQGFGEIVNGDDATRDVRISTDKPPASDSPERQVWEDKQKAKQEQANQKRDAYIAKQKAPLTDDQLNDIKAGNIDKEVAQKMFEQMNTAVLLAFYEQNGLFRGSDAAWERFRIHPDDIRRAVDLTGVPGAAGKDAFEYLIDLSVGEANPDAQLMKIPMERARAMRYLDSLSTDPELMEIPRDQDGMLAWLGDKAFQRGAQKVFKNFDSIFDDLDQKPVTDQRADIAREILLRKGVLGKDAADKVEDPLFELQKQLELIETRRAETARKILARPKVWGEDFAKQSQDPVEDLLQRAARAHGIRNLQPKPSDRLLVHPPHKTVEDSYQAAVAFTSEQRGKLMEHLWDTFHKPYADVILKAREQKIDKELEKKKDQKKDQNKKDKNQQQQQGDKQQGDPQEGEGGEGGEGGENNEGGDASPDISDDDDSNGDGQKQDSGIEIEDEENEGGEGDPSDDDDDVELSDDDLDDIGDLNDKPDKGREKENNENSKSSKDKDGDKNDQQDGKPGDGGDPQDAQDSDANGGGEGWEQDDKPPEQRKDKKVGDLKDKTPSDEKLTDEQKEALKEAAEKRREERLNGADLDEKDNKRDFDTSKYAKGNWDDFYQRVQELMPVIQHREQIYRRILAEQQQELTKQSAEKFTLLANDGDIRGRLDHNRVLAKKFKKITGQSMTLDDLKQIRADEVLRVNSSVESVSLIDGSGSMNMQDLGNGVTAMDVAFQSAVIDYMAARRAGIGGYIIMWGDNAPYVIATPSTPLKEVGKRLEAVRQGRGTNTNLAPALLTSIDELANFVTKKTTVSGTSLVTIYSDGEIQDFARAAEKMTKLTKSAKNLSIEVAVLTSKSKGTGAKTEMEKLFDEVIKETGDRLVSVMRGNDARVVPLEVGRRALQRLRKFKVKLEPDSQKRARFKKLSAQLKDK